MTQRKVIKNVTDMEIDEISVVDRGANQHAAVTIAKRAPEEETMPELFNEAGELLAEDSLEDGQIVFDAEGNAYQFELDTEAEEAEVTDEATEVVEETEDRELELAKGFADPFRTLAAAAKAKVPAALASPVGQRAQAAGAKVAGGAKSAFAGATKTPGRALATGAAVGTAGGAGAVSAFGNKDGLRKSFSEEVMEELSKAMTDEDRDEVLSKALGTVEALLAEQAEYAEIAKSERELRLTNEYIAKAAEYNLPVDPAELGPVLYRMVETMDHEDCAVIAKCLDAASNALFAEVGFIGGGDNVDPLEQVNALAAEQIGKSDSAHNAFLDVMDANPGAYDEYLAARRGY